MNRLIVSVVLGLLALVVLSGCLETNPVACTADAKICPDGSAVGREGPNCAFKACPTTDVNNDANVQGCTKELFVCPDGSSVGRIQPNCAFAPCPDSSSLLIEFRSVGGFSLASESVLRLEKNKAGLVISYRDKAPARAQIAFSQSEWKAWENAVRDSGILEIKQADLKTCNEGDVDCPTDMPIRRLLVQFDQKTNQMEWYFLKENDPKLEALLEKINALHSDLWERATNGGVWLTTKPLQCSSNPWEKWEADSNRVYIRAPTEQEIMTNWLKEVHQIEVLEYLVQSTPPGVLVCQACDCPRGDTIAIRVTTATVEQAKKAGFQDVACTEEAKTCPNGNIVGREPPFCAFKACNPDSNAFLLEFELSGGFVPYEIAGTTTLRLENQQAVLTHSFVKSGESFSKTKPLTTPQWKAWQDAVTASGILNLKQADLECEANGPCVADAPNRKLVVTANGKNVELSTDQPQSSPAWAQLMDRIDALVEELDVARLAIAPKQCQTNPWQIAPSLACNGKEDGTVVFSGDTCNACSCQNDTAVCTLAYCAASEEEALVKAYLNQMYGIEVRSYQRVVAPEGIVVCAACSCSRGDSIEIEVDGWQAGRLMEAGWTLKSA